VGKKRKVKQQKTMLTIKRSVDLFSTVITGIFITVFLTLSLETKWSLIFMMIPSSSKARPLEKRKEKEEEKKH